MDSFRTTGEGKAVLQWHASGHGGPLLPAPRHRATVTNQPRRSLFSAVDASELAWQRIAAFDGRDPIATLKCTVHVGIVPANIIPSAHLQSSRSQTCTPKPLGIGGFGAAFDLEYVVGLTGASGAGCYGRKTTL